MAWAETEVRGQSPDRFQFLGRRQAKTYWKPSRLELRCVRSSVRTSTKRFSHFHLIWCVGRPRPDGRNSLTSTRSKVQVKVTELPKLPKVHFSRSISSAGFAWSSKLMVDSHSMGPGLQRYFHPVVSFFFYLSLFLA